MDYTKLNDEALIRLIIQARAEALSELYDRYSRLVFSLVLNVIGDRASAEEITQDVFFRVWEKARTYQVNLAKVSTWVTSIARNRAIDELRKRNIRPEGHSVGWQDLPIKAITAMDGVDPEETTEQAFQARKIRDAISNLPQDQQQVLVLAFFHGYTHSQIAVTLHEPLGTVKTRIRLAMQKLRTALTEDHNTADQSEGLVIT